MKLRISCSMLIRTGLRRAAGGWGIRRRRHVDDVLGRAVVTFTASRASLSRRVARRAGGPGPDVGGVSPLGERPVRSGARHAAREGTRPMRAHGEASCSGRGRVLNDTLDRDKGSVGDVAVLHGVPLGTLRGRVRRSCGKAAAICAHLGRWLAGPWSPSARGGRLVLHRRPRRGRAARPHRRVDQPDRAVGCGWRGAPVEG